jgi:hypothetical protein
MSNIYVNTLPVASYARMANQRIFKETAQGRPLGEEAIADIFEQLKAAMNTCLDAMGLIYDTLDYNSNMEPDKLGALGDEIKAYFDKHSDTIELILDTGRRYEIDTDRLTSGAL